MCELRGRRRIRDSRGRQAPPPGGFLELLRFDPSDNSVEFHIPSKILTYADGSVLSYSLIWYKDEGGRMKDESEGPAFELRAENSDHGPDWIDCETADDLEGWLGDLREADHY